MPTILTRTMSVVLCSLLLVSSATAQVYELRTYTTNDGKLDALHSRFRNHTMKLFEKHGMENIGYWVPTDEDKSQNTLIYIVQHDSREAANKSWQGFGQDPDWQSVYQQSTVDGKLVAKVDRVFMQPTDYSPQPKSGQGDEQSVYELRIYNTNEGKLTGLNTRFRDHTMRLFEKHGIENIGYWTPTEGPESENQLIYLIRHKSPAAAEASWAAFRNDPEWKKVAEESQKDGRFLSGPPISIYLKPTDYSPMK